MIFRSSLSRLGRLAALAVTTLGLLAGPSGAALADEDFLPVAEAFKTAATADADAIVVSYTAHAGYYLYQQRLGYSTATPGVTLAAPVFPKGLPHKDDYFGAQEIYRGAFSVRVPFHRQGATPTAVDVMLKFQGCADKGLCYPPQTQLVHVLLPAPAPATPEPVAAAAAATGSLLGKITGGAQADEDFLPVEKAFAMTAEPAGANAVHLSFAIAPGYYLYKARISVAGSSPGIELGALALPTGLPHKDDYFGEQEIYRGHLEATVPFARASAAAGTLALTVRYQGCADKGLCYPPQSAEVNLALPAASAADVGAAPGSKAGAVVSEQDRLGALVATGSLWLVIGTFFLAGLVLALTPCVLPMVPILSGIIAGDGENVTPARGFALSVAYVLGMAVTYAGAGAIAALAGKQAQAFFQQTWILVLFAGLFIVLALAMFGLFELQMPSALQTRFASASNQIKGGKFLSTALMGALSSLVVTACVAPPLVAVLTFIGQSGNVLRGALALFAMAIGMGMPLLVVGASAGKLLPKAGPWMETVKAVFGVVFLGVAAWMFDRLLPARLEMLLWAGVVFSLVWVLLAVGLRGGRRTVTRWALGALVGLYGLCLIVGAALGGTDPLKPFAGTGLFGNARTIEALPFKPIHSVAELDAELAAAGKAGSPVLLDFYADWCVSCKEMEAHTYREPAVRAALGRFVLLKADVTANDANDQALLKRFNIIGPPTTAFFQKDGQERRNFRLVGFVAGEPFLEHLKRFESAP
jgi:thiol:disulfide interchange protein DsbD